MPFSYSQGRLKNGLAIICLLIQLSASGKKGPFGEAVTFAPLVVSA